MGRILAIDFGIKRCGLAVTDPLKIVATALDVVPPKELIYFIKQYHAREPLEKVIIGYALNDDGSATDSTPHVDKFMRNFEKVFPLIPIEKVDEAFSSKNAAEEIAKMGLRKGQKETKGLLDQVAATLLLQEYLNQ